MTRKSIFIEFANPKIKAVDHILDILEAADYAQFNLYVRHKIRLQKPYVLDDRVILEMDIPENLGETINYGNHLRGISIYLLKNRGDFYKKYRIGNRLLYYMEMEKGGI